MVRAASVPGLGSEYNNFLFAAIGADKNGTLLSVLSALARLDLDPWQEAAGLARLSGEAATQRLASLIAAMPDGPSVPTETGMLAARLIALLPRRALSGIPSRKVLLGLGPVTGLRAIGYAILVLTVLLLGAEWLVSSRPPLMQTGTSLTATSGTHTHSR